MKQAFVACGDRCLVFEAETEEEAHAQAVRAADHAPELLAALRGKRVYAIRQAFRKLGR